MEVKLACCKRRPDKQRNKETKGNQRKKQRNRETKEQRNKGANKQRNKATNNQPTNQTNKEASKQTNTQTINQSFNQSIKQTNKQTNISGLFRLLVLQNKLNLRDRHRPLGGQTLPLASCSFVLFNILQVHRCLQKGCLILQSLHSGCCKGHADIHRPHQDLKRKFFEQKHYRGSNAASVNHGRLRARGSSTLALPA